MTVEAAPDHWVQDCSGRTCNKVVPWDLWLPGTPATSWLPPGVPAGRVVEKGELAGEFFVEKPSGRGPVFFNIRDTTTKTDWLDEVSSPYGPSETVR